MLESNGRIPDGTNVILEEPAATEREVEQGSDLKLQLEQTPRSFPPVQLGVDDTGQSDREGLKVPTTGVLPSDSFGVASLSPRLVETGLTKAGLVNEGSVVSAKKSVLIELGSELVERLLVDKGGGTSAAGSLRIR